MGTSEPYYIRLKSITFRFPFRIFQILKNIGGSKVILQFAMAAFLLEMKRSSAFMKNLFESVEFMTFA